MPASTEVTSCHQQLVSERVNIQLRLANIHTNVVLQLIVVLELQWGDNSRQVASLISSDTLQHGRSIKRCSAPMGA